jgi:hypothetical protein
MKRGPGPKRTGGLKKTRPTKGAITAARMIQVAEFKEYAREQRVCAVCGSTTSDFDGHHVIELQYLKKNGMPHYLRPNALRLCNRFSKNDCHGKHTNGSRKIRIKELLDENLIYAIQALGPDRAEVYIHRHYKGNDRRFDEMLEEARGER